jgi:RNA polymerase sigma-70 factor (ECF subfamily)
MLPVSSDQVTGLLIRWSEGESAALEKLIPLIYDELRRLARRCLAGERPGHTLQSTALVHEAYLRLAGHSSMHWDNRVHFFAVAARLMRRILVDHARMHSAKKRGGDQRTVASDDAVALPRQRELDLVALDDAMHELARIDPEQAQMVEMRFFAGMSIEETAQVLGCSPATVKRNWATVRAWLYREMQRPQPNRRTPATAR